MPDEKRRFTRFPFKGKTELTVHDKVYVVDEITNLSIGGCLLPIETDYEPGTPCTVRIILDIPGGKTNITVKGTVVRREKGKLAIKFVSIDPDSLHHLKMLAIYNAGDPDRVVQEIKEHPGLV